VNRPQQTLASITLRNWRLRPSALGLKDWSFEAPLFIGDTVHPEVTIVDKRFVSDGRRSVIARAMSLVKSDGTVSQKGLAELLVDLQNGKSP
jgi:acyl dehydratase